MKGTYFHAQFLRLKRRLDKRKAICAVAAAMLTTVYGQPPLVVASGEGLVGITFDPTGALVVASNDTVYGFVNTAAAPSTAH